MPALRTASFDEPSAISDFLKYEIAQEYCRDAATIVSGAGVLEKGTVLGKVTAGAASSAAKSGGNTGNGTFVLDGTNPVQAGAKAGVYKLRVTSVPAAHGSVWELLDPDGFSLGNPVVAGSGGTYTIDNDIKGVLTDGGTDWVVGDGFDVTVAAGSAKWKACSPDAKDGSQVAAGVLLQDVDATSADKSAVILARGPAVVARLGLKWHASLNTNAERDAAAAQLAAVGIIVRSTA